MAPDPAIARKVGEGVDRPGGDNELPIDINYQKLSEWLTSRQKLPGDWHKRVAAIQVKMIESVKELPTEVLSKTKGGVEAPLDYFRAKEISSAMSAKAERTMFGGLTGAAATWDKIVKAYEKGNVWLGEAAQSMLQNADYEIPFLQKQAAKLDSQVSDCERKHAEYLKSASQCAATFKLECKKMGIEGKSLRMELAALTSIELPEQLSSVVESLKGEVLEDAFKYYKAFSEFVHGEGAVVGALLPILNEVHSGTTERPKLDTSTTEPPSTSADISIDWDVIDMDAEEEQGGGGGAEIDWAGASEGGKGGAAPTIEWDLDMVVVDEEGGGEGGAADAAGGDGGIQWDIDMTGAGTGLGESGETGGGCAPAIDIDWDLDPEELKAEELKQKLGLAESGVGVAPEGASAMGARDLDLPAAVVRLEKDAEYRARLLDDLQELRAFLMQRKTDLSSTGTTLLSTLMHEGIQNMDMSRVSAMLEMCNKALTGLTADRLRQLLLIATSRRFLDRLVNNLQRKAGQEAKMLAASKEVQARQRESKAQLVALAPKVKDLMSRTRSMKGASEAGISGLLNGRKVNILGEINTILSQAA